MTHPTVYHSFCPSLYFSQLATGMSKVFQRSSSTAGVYSRGHGGCSPLSKQQSLVKNTTDPASAASTASTLLDEKSTGLTNIPEDRVSTLSKAFLAFWPRYSGAIWPPNIIWLLAFSRLNGSEVIRCLLCKKVCTNKRKKDWKLCLHKILLS